MPSDNLLPRVRQSFMEGRAISTKCQTIRNSINSFLLHSHDLWIRRTEKKDNMLICLFNYTNSVYFFFSSLLQRTSVVSSSVEWQNGRAIQKQSRYDRAQRAHHKKGEILAELCTGPERWDAHIVCVILSLNMNICTTWIYVNCTKWNE